MWNFVGLISENSRSEKQKYFKVKKITAGKLELKRI